MKVGAGERQVMGNKSGHRERKATVCEGGSWPGGPGSGESLYRARDSWPEGNVPVLRRTGLQGKAFLWRGSGHFAISPLPHRRQKGGLSVLTDRRPKWGIMLTS